MSELGQIGLVSTFYNECDFFFIQLQDFQKAMHL